MSQITVTCPRLSNWGRIYFFGHKNTNRCAMPLLGIIFTFFLLMWLENILGTPNTTHTQHIWHTHSLQHRPERIHLAKVDFFIHHNLLWLGYQNTLNINELIYIKTHYICERSFQEYPDCLFSYNKWYIYQVSKKRRWSKWSNMDLMGVVTLLLPSIALWFCQLCKWPYWEN